MVAAQARALGTTDENWFSVDSTTCLPTQPSKASRIQLIAFARH
jgi:hypothetical protein